LRGWAILAVVAVHFGVIYLLQRVSPRFEIIGNQTANSMLCLLAVATATIGISFVSYQLVEKTGIRIGRDIIGRIQTHPDRA
jgi:peptidoglycan/LPS O-acetylase OafA/YrhL